MIRFQKRIFLAIILMTSLGITGCASTLTLMSPVKSEVVVKSKRTGPFARYDYYYVFRSNRLLLERTPICNEMAKTVRVEKKLQIGYGPALLEMPFFGLGLIDIASARAISEASEKVYPLDEQETGKLLTCGSIEPAAGEVLILENREQNIYRQVTTDKNGEIDLKKEMDDFDQAVNLTVRLQSDRAINFTVTYDAPVYSKVDGKAGPAGTGVF